MTSKPSTPPPRRYGDDGLDPVVMEGDGGEPFAFQAELDKVGGWVGGDGQWAGTSAHLCCPRPACQRLPLLPLLSVVREPGLWQQVERLGGGAGAAEGGSERGMHAA